MNGRTLLISSITALAFAASSSVSAQTSGSTSDSPADHHPAEPKASGQSGGPGAQGQGMPTGPGMMGPGMMMGQGQMGPGMMGPGMTMGPRMMGRGMMVGPGMMGAGMMHPGMMAGHHPHHGMMGAGMMHPGMMMRHHRHHGMMMGAWGYGRRLSLSAEDVKRIVDGRLALRGLKHLKAGPVKIVDEDTASADIVTKDGSLAVRLRVDRNTGYAVIAE